MWLRTTLVLKFMCKYTKTQDRWRCSQKKLILYVKVQNRDNITHNWENALKHWINLTLICLHWDLLDWDLLLGLLESRSSGQSFLLSCLLCVVSQTAPPIVQEWILASCRPVTIYFSLGVNRPSSTIYAAFGVNRPRHRKDHRADKIFLSFTSLLSFKAG